MSCDAAKHFPRLGERDGIPAAHSRAFGEQTRREDEAGRFAHVVRVRLECEAEQGDRLPAERAEVLHELPDDAALLELVHLDDSREQLEVVARVGSKLLERRVTSFGKQQPE